MCSVSLEYCVTPGLSQASQWEHFDTAAEDKHHNFICKLD